jgi:hypothetical protein
MVLVDLPTSLHPMIDDYLTIKERQDLLERYGWIKIVTAVTGQKYCYSANPIRMNKELKEWLSQASFMMDVTVHMKISNTGESYL